MTADTIATYNLSEVRFNNISFVALPPREGTNAKIFVLQENDNNSRVHFLISGTVKNISSSQYGTNYSFLPKTCDGQAIRDLVQEFENRSPYVDVATPEFKNHLSIKVPYPEMVDQVKPPFDATLLIQATFYYNDEKKKAGLSLKLIDIVSYEITIDPALRVVKSGLLTVEGGVRIDDGVKAKPSIIERVEKF